MEWDALNPALVTQEFGSSLWPKGLRLSAASVFLRDQLALIFNGHTCRLESMRAHHLGSAAWVREPALAASEG